MDITVAVLWGVLWNDQTSSALCVTLQSVCTWHLAGIPPEPRLSQAQKQLMRAGWSSGF